MSTTPVISVIIPVYNVEKYLTRCLESIIAQTFHDFEVICVNDGSEDNSAQILLEFSAKDLRIKIINQTNQGQSVARNRGIEAASGRYIYFVDSDDFIHPQLLEISYYFMTAYNADMITFKHDKTFHKKSFHYDNQQIGTVFQKYYDRFDAIKFKITKTPLYFFKKNCTYKMSYYVWARIYQRALLKNVEFLPDNCFEDDPFIIAICQKHPTTILLKEPLYYYVDNSAGISNTTKVQILTKHIEDYHKGIIYIWEQYKNSPKKDFDCIAKEIVARRLRIQCRKIKRADKSIQPQLYKAFINELKELQEKNLLRCSLNPRKFFYWIKCRKILNNH